MTRAFTLIELLVVITIIVVLLALLTPALDRAIYQAELTVCGSQMKGIAGGVTVYAANHGRFFPLRETLGGEGRSMKVYENGGREDRQRIRGYVAIKSLMDPLCDQSVDISPEVTLPDSHVYSNLNLYFGHQVHGGGAMRKLGDRMAFNDGLAMHNFSILAADMTAIHYANFLMQMSHPDAQGVLRTEAVQDQKIDGLTPNGLIGNRYTYAQWAHPGNTGASPALGALDLNFAAADGSVFRLTAVSWDQQAQQFDERMVRVDTRPGNQDAFFDDHLPAD